MTHLQREIDRLKRNILSLSALVEENLQQGVPRYRVAGPHDGAPGHGHGHAHRRA